MLGSLCGAEWIIELEVWLRLQAVDNGHGRKTIALRLQMIVFFCLVLLDLLRRTGVFQVYFSFLYHENGISEPDDLST